LADIAHAVFLITGKNKDIDVKLKINIFETAIRMRHKYLTMVYREDIYCAEAVDALAEKDRVTFYAGTAFLCRDKGDIIEGFITNMDRVTSLDPELKTIVTLVAASMIVPEPTPEPPAPNPVKDQETANEIASLKEAIYGLIDKGDRLRAAQILRSYAQINPTDPEIKSIQQLIVGGGN
jgi:hypothetical protein